MNRSAPDPECARHAELLSAAVDAELDTADRRTLDAHLARCPECRDLRDTLAGLRRRTLVAPAPALDPLVDRIAPARWAAVTSRRIRNRRVGVAAALCSIVIGLLVGVFALQRGSATGPLHTAMSGDSDSTVATPLGPSTHDHATTTVTLIDDRSDHDDVVVDRGTRVRWVNDDPDVHHLVIHSSGARIDNVLAPDSAEAVTFTEPGTFRFDCVIHPSVTGTVTVL